VGRLNFIAQFNLDEPHFIYFLLGIIFFMKYLEQKSTKIAKCFLAGVIDCKEFNYYNFVLNNMPYQYYIFLKNK
jgi:hypothetical protein